jgi:hypothetical protein
MSIFVHNKEKLKGVVQKTPNVVIQKIQEGTDRDLCFIIGSGYSLNVDEEDRVSWHDPAMIKHNYRLRKEITVYIYFYTYECEGLAAAAEEIAQFTNSIFEEHERIFFVGYSKCALCLCKATEYLKDLVTLATISPPIHGTIIADQEAIEKMVKSPILMWMYRKIFSNHKIDKDIIPGSEFLKGLKEPICKEHINIRSKLSVKKIYLNPIDYFLLLVDKVLKLDGDGIVPFASQQAKTEKQITIDCSHVSSLKVGLRLIEEYSRLMK